MRKYKRIAVYPSVLYGEDFIRESVQSILPFVDRVFVVMMQRPWGGTDGVRYQGKWITWPSVFDSTRRKIGSMFDPKVTLVEAHKADPWNRWGYGVNSVIRGQVGIDTQEVLILDPDCVFSDEQAQHVFADWEGHIRSRPTDNVWAHINQVELWRTPAWCVERQRAMASLHSGDLDLISSDRRGKRPTPVSIPLAGHVHNLGFCVSKRTMLWKHLTALAFSPVIGESLPDPDWYDKRWLSWDPVTNNQDLEVTLGMQSQISHAVPYDIEQLPYSIRRRYDADEWPRYGGR